MPLYKRIIELHRLEGSFLGFRQALCARFEPVVNLDVVVGYPGVTQRVIRISGYRFAEIVVPLRETFFCPLARIKEPLEIIIVGFRIACGAPGETLPFFSAQPQAQSPYNFSGNIVLHC
jgi:hypothetical protein